jgi:hypothetical protein
MKASHPINFLPHQYEGYTPRERGAIREENLEMILYRPDADFWASYKNEIENCYQVKRD